MAEKIEMSDVHDYWSSVASAPTDADGLRPTARDPYLQDAVESAVEKWLHPGSTIFDFGCGDGRSTLRFAKTAGKIVGGDYIDAFVEAAKANARRLGFDEATFERADVTDLGPVMQRHGTADIAITIRCLINLTSWQLQAKAIDEIASTLCQDGLYILSEGWTEGWEGLNRMRLRAGLGPVEVVKYNRLISRLDFERHVSRTFHIVHYESLGFYIFMSRVFQPAFVQPEEPKHTHNINRIAAELFAKGLGTGTFEEVDYAGIYVLRRKG